MNILIVSNGDITYDSGYGARTFAEATVLAAAGHNVRVLCFLHVKKFWFGRKGAKRFSDRLRQVGVRCTLMPTPPDFKVPALITLLHVLQHLTIRLIRMLSASDLVYAENVSAAYISLLGNQYRPVLCDMHGDTIAELGERVPRPRDLHFRIDAATKMERHVVANAAGMISVSGKLEDVWRGRNAVNIRSIVIPCAVDTHKFRSNPDRRTELRKEWRATEDDPVFVYAGSVHHYQQIDWVSRLFARVIQIVPRAKMLYLISSNGLPYARQCASDNGIPSDAAMFFSVPHTEVPNFLSAADLGFLLRQDLRLNRVASPTKFGEYLACGLPVIATPWVESVAESVRNSGLGVLVSGDDPADSETVARFSYDVVRNRLEWTDRCTRAARERWSWEQQGTRLDGFVRATKLVTR